MLSASKPTGRPQKLNEEQAEALRKQAEQYQDWTLAEHAEAIELAYGVKLAVSTVDLYFRRWDISYKKRASTPVSEIKMKDKHG